ncbi:MAG: multidrug effflux MFS transporter [Woeseia sp.]|nr:multidrug effflux MFS transporter [Woeseia sp.]
MNSHLAGRRRFVLVLGFLTGLAAVTIDMSLPAIPGMVQELATTMAAGQQIVGWFMAGIALGQLPAGLMSDRIGRMPVLYTGVAIFTIAGTLCAVSTSIEIMLVARFFQGIGASVGIVVSRAIVRDIASGKDAARLLTIMVMIFTAAPMLAPIVGSFLVTWFDWRMPFFAIALFGGLMIYGVSRGLTETRQPVRDQHILRQLVMSIAEFFRYRRSILGVLLVMLTAGGFMAMITGSAALIIDIYGYPVAAFGIIFAMGAFGILVGSMINRRLLLRFSPMQIMGVGAALIGIAAVQMLIIAWRGEAPFWWLWSNVGLYLAGTGMLLPNATALALDPVPAIAGVAASIIGTLQNVAAAASSIGSSLLYDGTISNVVLTMGICGAGVVVTYFVGSQLLRTPKTMP